MKSRFIIDIRFSQDGLEGRNSVSEIYEVGYQGAEDAHDFSDDWSGICWHRGAEPGEGTQGYLLSGGVGADCRPRSPLAKHP
jgi:hypothetical protein